ncbi:hypothetical protein PPYR_05937 [Photinus pyralis]|uniref:G-protein coupled receptors family 2 profile 2 domain-containing protein n=1 Tax=Photinus pyralis TaxID=7054 RepID=A0A5N4AS81_PHOPY|nr:adhesion G-protein coupled receptor G4-like [Photinus pyralis]KAB0800197.1 hypothetical protein PPYR_05937 [Photinus pyralis]
MISYKEIVLLLLLLGCSSVVQSRSCPTVYSDVNSGGNKIKVVWNARDHSNISIAISEPPCLDLDKHLVVRICSNGTWLPSKECHYVDFNNVCPPDFKEEKGKCTYVTQPQMWDDKCPYPDASTEVNNHKNIWLPFQQKIKHGAYEYILPDENYGLPYSETTLWEHSSEIFYGNSECVAKTSSKIENVSCNTSFSRVCLYNHNSFLYRCPNNCVPGGLGSNYCFCKSPKNTSCTLASLRYTYEKDLLYDLVGNDVCLLGPGKMLDNHYLAINKHSLHLKQANDGNCVVCKTEPIAFHDHVVLDLTFKASSQKLYLNIYSPEGLYKVNDNVQVFCFTDATNKLKYRVNTKEKFDSRFKSPSHRRYKVFKVSLVEDGPGYYWCEAFLLPTMEVITSNKVLAHKGFKYREYSLRLKIKDLCAFSRVDCKIPTEDFIGGVCKSLFTSEAFNTVSNVRLFRIYDIDTVTDTVDVLVHLSVKSKLSNKEEYEILKHTLNSLAESNVIIVFFKSSTECFAEVTNSGSILHWDSTLINTKAVPKEICVRDDGTPITRRCFGDFHVGAHWEDITESCSKSYKVSSKTKLLSSLAHGNASTDRPVSLAYITANTSDFTELDMHYLSKTLMHMTGSRPPTEDLVADVSQIINNLMQSNSTTLRSSQRMLNATDELLDTFESALNSVHFTSSSILLVNSDIIVHVTKPFLNNVSGISVRGLFKDTKFLNSTVTELYSNATFDDLVSHNDLEIAVYVPEALLKIMANNEPRSNLANITIVTTIFYSDKFFNSERDRSDRVGSRIVSVTISNREDYLEIPIPIIFKSRNNNKQKRCAFWNYGLRSSNGTGHWDTLGGDKMHDSRREFDTCFFSHLTNFALLIRWRHRIGDTNSDFTKTMSNIGKLHDDILSTISNIGCAFSIFGIAGIFLTAFLFKTWREKVGTKILMHLCVALFLQVVFLNLAADEFAKHSSDVFCKVIGIILHYVTIAEFAWMLVAAILQFYRFVKVVGPMPNRIILKACVIGWGFPLIPIAATCSIDIDSYSASNDGICYPTGLAMYIGVFLPIAFIVISNLVLFSLILRNIFHLKVESNKGTTILKRQVCLTVLLFFLLGMPWVFGVVAEIIQGSWLSYILLYIFCFTATLQGFVLFIFYVILDKSTRILWIDWIAKIRDKYK